MSDRFCIDIGCGPNKKAGFKGCDRIAFDGVDFLFDAGVDRWPFEDSSVDEAHASHFLEHLTNLGDRWERTHFFNELYRVLKPDAGCLLILPHWSSNRYYGDPTHKEPFSEMGFYYLSREWRLSQAPHTDRKFFDRGYDCNFEATWGYNLHQQVTIRNSEFQQFATQFYKEACQDLIATVKAKK